MEPVGRFYQLRIPVKIFVLGYISECSIPLFFSK